LPVHLVNENLKTTSCCKAQRGPWVTPLFKQLCEKLVLLERINYIVNTNVQYM